ncbi:MAG: hypothetical protein L0Z53_11995 [Acidobacteriales bacterium]|nr:hypothetical protein [Terriglobales bacterium]MCI0625413.1 hypothetical protein [Acidobacteriota bacterium]
MGRLILAVVLGYAVMFAFVFLTFSAAYLAMGTDGAFQPGTYEASMQWLVVSFVLGFIGAMAGGCTAVWIAQRMKAGHALALVVLVLGFALAGAMAMAPADTRPTVRTGDVPNFEAMQNARQPMWVALLNPLVGAIGVIVGARMKGAPTA